MGFRVVVQRSGSKLGEILTDWNRQSGFRIPIVVEETATKAYVFVGMIYGRKTEPLTQLAEEFRNPQNALKHDGRFLFLAYDKQTASIEVWVDKYRLLGAFLVVGPDSIIVSNDQSLCRSDLARLEIDSQAVLDVLLFGYVQPPYTLYVGATMLAGHATFHSERLSQEDWREHWPQQLADGECIVDTVALYRGFQLAVANIMQHWRPDTFRMSAGVDTRLVAGALSREQLGRLKFEVVCAPYLAEDDERDVIGAKRVASALGVRLEVLHMPPEQSAYFLNLADGTMALSGLYGGEFLGGVMLDEDGPQVATQTKGILNLSSDFQIDLALETAVRSRFEQAMSTFGTRRFLTSVYLGSFRSAIYRSIVYGWSNPNRLGQLALSPFSERCFLDLLLQAPNDAIANYALYGALVRKFLPVSLQAIPFCSPITKWNSDLPTSNDGRDPKFRPSVSETSTLDAFPRLGIRLADCGIRWLGVPSNPLALLRLHNLQNILG